MESVPNRLLELIADRKVVPFLGAGFSTSSGLPSWYSLVNSMISNFAPHGNEGLIRSLANIAGKSDVAEILDSLSPTEFAIKEFLYEQICSPKYQPSEYHKCLLDLHSDTIITTNWDVLIENAHLKNYLSCHVIYRDADVAAYDPNREVQLLKIHGTITDLDSIIYRKSQYEKFWSDRRVLLNLVSTLMATRSFLFIGYGFGDPNILEVLQKLKDCIGRPRREHYALTFGNNRMAHAWQNLGVHMIQAPNFDPDLQNFQTSTLQFLQELSGMSRGISISNLERAKLVNNELVRFVRRMPPEPILRMRGSLGWLSNPVPIPNDPVYGSDIQDKEERKMTDLVCELLDASPLAKLRSILHLDMKALLRRGFKPEHLLRRLGTVREMLRRYKDRIDIVHDAIPSQLNHMIFDDQVSLLGFKRSTGLGIERAVLVRDRATVRTEVQQFDDDYSETLEHNRAMASRIGIDTNLTTWRSLFIERLIEEQIRNLSIQMSFSDVVGNFSSLLIERPPTYDGLQMFALATEFAVQKHEEYKQTREDGITPYAVHPLRVVERLRTVGLIDDYEILSAAVMHDVVEDCEVSLAYIETTFGKRVATIVDQLSKKAEQGAEGYLSQLKNANREAKTVKLADRWDNVEDLMSFRKERFGSGSSEEYIWQSTLVLEICRDANTWLATSLESRIRQASILLKETRGFSSPSTDPISMLPKLKL